MVMKISIHMKPRNLGVNPCFMLPGRVYLPLVKLSTHYRITRLPGNIMEPGEGHFSITPPFRVGVFSGTQATSTASATCHLMPAMASFVHNKSPSNTENTMPGQVEIGHNRA